MFTKSLIASLVVLGTLGTATAAFAEPRYDNDDRPTVVVKSGDADHDHDRDQPVVSQPVSQQPAAWQQAPQWGHGPVLLPVKLADDAKINIHGESIFHVATQRGFRTLAVKADDGVTKVQQVKIIFANHTEQVVNTNRTLDHGEALTIQLKGNAPRTIKEIVVYGREKSANGTFELVAT